MLISAALAALVGPLAILLIGSVVTWPAVLAVVLVWLAGSAVALFVTAQAPPRRHLDRRLRRCSRRCCSRSSPCSARRSGPPPRAAITICRPHRGRRPAVSVADLRETGEGDVHRFDLEARHQTITLPDGSDYDAVTFGSVPGPELVVTQGELVEVTLTNRDVDGRGHPALARVRRAVGRRRRRRCHAGRGAPGRVVRLPIRRR